MPAITINRRDLLHPAHERDVWVNIVGTFRRVDGMTLEDLVVDLCCAARGVGSWGDDWGRVTCVLDTTSPRQLRRLAHALLVEHGASAEVEWTYEVAPQPVERLGADDPRDPTRLERAFAVVAHLLLRRC